MARTYYENDSAATLDGGKKGFLYGAVGGAALFGIVTLILDMVGIGTGGAVLAAAAGAAVGGLAGTIFGALSARRSISPQRGYSGPERRLGRHDYAGLDRRMARQ